ncbi:MAG: HEAT repeat domain-containing protein [Deltaproteobacteria bacterium]|nr:HEAT repeat domain-containing protein [Deltaproteobacteria bacterium]
MNLVDARQEAERLSRAGRQVEGARLLIGALPQAYASEDEYAPAVRVLGRLLGEIGDARAALTCVWYTNLGDGGDSLFPHITPADRARSLAARAFKMGSSDGRAMTLLSQAASEFEAATLIAQAAVCREKAGEFPTARGLWSRLCQMITGSSEGDLYACGLARFNLARTSRNVGDMKAAREATVAAVHFLEQAADRYETLGQRERAFDCYHVLVAIGREFSTLEHVLEGYVNLIRILREDQLRSHALQSYEEAIRFVREKGEISAAATLARELSAFARKQGMVPVANNAMHMQAEMWHEVAKATLAREGPPEIAENALLAAVLCHAEVGQFRRVGETYVELGNLPIESARCAHYARASQRYRDARDERVESMAWSQNYQRDAPFPDVWHVDLVEWEQRGSATDACADILLAPEPWSEVVRRRALAARLTALQVEAPDAKPTAEARVGLVKVLEPIELYSILSPLERLAGDPDATVRAAVARALGRFLYKRTFIPLRRLLSDADSSVKQEGNRALEQLRFPHAFDPLARIYRESTEPESKLAALRALAHVDTEEAAEMVVGVLLHAGPSERESVLSTVAGSRGDRLVKAAQAALPTASAEVAASLRAVLKARGING